MNIAYLAQTETSTMLLDPDGICLQARSRAGRHAERTADGATRCVGAQYVASMDKNEDGGLIEKPRLGCPMLFAATNKDGRIYLVRTGPLVHFEEVSSGVHERGSLPLQEQSAPEPPTVRFKEYDGSEEATTPFRKARRESGGMHRASSVQGPSRGGNPGPTPRVPRIQAPAPTPLPAPPAPAERALARATERPIASSVLPPPPMRSTGSGRTAAPPPLRRTAPPPARSAARVAPPPPDTPREMLTSLPDEDFELAPPSSVSPSPAAPAFDLRRRPLPGNVGAYPSSAPPPALPRAARRR